MHASLIALINSAGSERIAMMLACDHEELGSESRSGASGPLLADVITRISNSLGARMTSDIARWPRSIFLSADAGHAIHPNYPGVTIRPTVRC